jgi:signal transduction histidine kinase
MRNLRFKDSIAINYIVTTALLIGIVFVAFFMAVNVVVPNHLNEEIKILTTQHLDAIEVKDCKVSFKSHDEWLEREHNTVGVSPVFIEFVGVNGELIDKSPNLKDSRLHFNPEAEECIFYDDELVEKRIRQAQTPIYNSDNEVIGYLLIAISREGVSDAIVILKNIMLITYPIVLIVLFFVARFIAGRNIAPINSIIETSNRITHQNLKERILLPVNKDELYTLSETINHLLDRLEGAVEREKNFTSYASHEFRTPLAVLKGTMEVLIRKPRTSEEYEKKIRYCIKKIDDLNTLVNQLLTITRRENEKIVLALESHSVSDLVNNSILNLLFEIEHKKIEVSISVGDYSVYTDGHIFSTILNNILCNAIKYSPENSRIEITATEENNKLCCEVRDYGSGITEGDMEHIFEKFYRSDAHSNASGMGLGLVIAKQCVELLKGELLISNHVDGGVVACMRIPLS